MMKRTNLWSGVALSAMLLAPLTARAASDDQVVPATTEDIQAFEKAVMEKTQAQDLVRDQTREQLRIREHQTAGEGSTKNAAVQERARIHAEKATQKQDRLGKSVSEEAKKMKGADEKTRKQLRKQDRDQERLRDETQEQARTRTRQGWDAVRDTTVQSGQRNGETAGPAGSGGTQSGSGSTGGNGSGNGSQGGRGN
jgi:hypothetical protein